MKSILTTFIIFTVLTLLNTSLKYRALLTIFVTTNIILKLLTIYLFFFHTYKTYLQYTTYKINFLLTLLKQTC